MNLSRKFIKETFRSKNIQINDKALDGIEYRLKNLVEHYAAVAKDREYKRVTPEKLYKLFNGVFNYENVIKER